MIVHVARRELLEHVRSARFLALCALAILLMPLGAHLEADAWARRHAHADWMEREADERVRRARRSHEDADHLRSGWQGGEVASDPALRALRRPAALSVLVAGEDRALPAWWQFSSEGLEAGAPARTASAIATAGALDLAFVVEVVLGLLAFLLTFDAIAGEHERGILGAVLAHPVPRVALVLGKFAGALATLAVPLLLGTAGAIAVLHALDVPLDGAPGAMMLLAVAALLYLAVMLAIGLLASTLAQRGRTALVALLLVWTVTVLVLPRMAAVGAATLRRVDGEETVLRARRDAIAALERERATLLMQAWRAASGSDTMSQGFIPPDVRRRYAAARAPIEEALFRRKRDALRAIDERHARALDAQRALARTLAFPSPAAAFSRAARELAGTGDALRTSWDTQLALHQRRLERDGFDRVTGVELFDARSGGTRVRWSPDWSDPADRPTSYDALTPFRFAAPSMADGARRALAPLALLVAMLVGALLAAGAAMVRYEVR